MNIAPLIVGTILVLTGAITLYSIVSVIWLSMKGFADNQDHEESDPYLEHFKGWEAQDV